MTPEQKEEIVKIGVEFATGFHPDIPSINGSGWLIVDPLSGYLNALGFDNTPMQLPATEQHPQVLCLEFADKSVLIPAGLDLKAVMSEVENWMWLY